MSIQRGKSKSGGPAQFRVILNLVLSGSKDMTSEEQDRALAPVPAVRLKITAGNDPTNVLVDMELPAKEFETGSVGYGCNLSGQTFSKVS